MRKLFLILFCIASTAYAGGSKKHNPSGIEAWLAGQRVEAINDMAPKIGLDPKTVLRSSSTFKPCEHTGQNSDGPYVDGSKTACPEIRDSVHAWCIPNPGARVRYMFAIVGASKNVSKEVRLWCIRHEVMHELLAHYGIGGHPLKVTLTRKDNGKSQTFKPAEIINGRWPSMVNAFIPEGMERQDEWADAACGTEEVMLGDGEGI
jgi:hypothetical protein